MLWLELLKVNVAISMQKKLCADPPMSALSGVTNATPSGKNGFKGLLAAAEDVSFFDE